LRCDDDDRSFLEGDVAAKTLPRFIRRYRVRCAGGSLRNCCTRDVRGPVVRLGMVTEAVVSTSCEKKTGLNRSEGSADAPKHEKELHRPGEQITRRPRSSYAFTMLGRVWATRSFRLGGEVEDLTLSKIRLH